jgi:hypothetical protein
MRGKAKYIPAFPVDLLWKRKKREKKLPPRCKQFHYCKPVKRLTIIYTTLHSSVPNRKHIYTVKNNQLPVFITR